MQQMSQVTMHVRTNMLGYNHLCTFLKCAAQWVCHKLQVIAYGAWQVQVLAVHSKKSRPVMLLTCAPNEDLSPILCVQIQQCSACQQAAI